MAALSALVSDVYSLTNRPDLTSETELAVKAATLKAHQSDYFPKDLFESGVVFDAASYFQSLAYRTLIPRYRSLKYIRKYDPNANNGAGEAGAYLTIITPEQSIDEYKIDREDVVYLAGDVLNIRSKTELQYILFGCYLNPDITSAGYSSWVSDDHPYCIVFEAARVVFKTIGYDEQAAVYEKLVQEQYAELKTSNILANGW